MASIVGCTILTLNKTSKSRLDLTKWKIQLVFFKQMINKKYKHIMIKLFNIYNYIHVETYTKMILNPILVQELETFSNIELDWKIKILFSPQNTSI